MELRPCSRPAREVVSASRIAACRVLSETRKQVQRRTGPREVAPAKLPAEPAGSAATIRQGSNFMKRILLVLGSHLLGLGVVCTFLTGCASTPKAALKDEVGHMTYEQAVHEMGSPSRTNAITDGGLIAQWITHRPGSSGFNVRGTGFYGPYAGINTYANDSGTKVLVMKFGPDHKLLDWTHVTR